MFFLLFLIVFVQAQTQYEFLTPSKDTNPETILRITKKLLKGKVQKIQMIVFLGVDCPISQKYINSLRNLKNKYLNQISIIGKVPNASNEEIELFKKEYKLNFPLRKDHKNKFVRLLGASVTPEVFILQEGKGLVYYGAIDNWFYELGKNRNVITENYLIDAIENLLVNIPVTQNHVPSVGCFIE
jgi:thiol-disulfide isomerase/thioredoxin